MPWVPFCLSLQQSANRHVWGTLMNGWLCVRLCPKLVYLYVPAWRVVHDMFKPKAFVVQVLLLAPVTPTFCPLRGNRVHANRSDELKSELHPDMPPKHTPAHNWAADFGRRSWRFAFNQVLHLYTVHAPRYAKMRAH